MNETAGVSLTRFVMKKKPRRRNEMKKSEAHHDFSYIHIITSG